MREYNVISAVGAALLLLLAHPAGAQTRVVLLGTGNPNANPDRSGPSVAVVVGGSAYLVDAGPGVVRRAAAAERRGVAALAQVNLRRVFITHLHSDHTLGLPDLIFTPWVLERSAALEVYGPPGIRQMVSHIQAAWAEDVRVRLDGWQPQNATGHRTRAFEVREGKVYEDSLVRVFAFAVPHGSWPHAFGYRFETRDRTVVISGDSRAGDAVVRACNGCDVLVHEVGSDAGFGTLDAAWRRYHSYFHTLASELAGIATRARPRLLVLYHQLLWGGVSADSLVGEVRRGYSGRVVSGSDLEVY
jgi:ribonuclease Z